MLVWLAAKTIRPAGRASQARQSGSKDGSSVVPAARPRILVHTIVRAASNEDGGPAHAMRRMNPLLLSRARMPGSRRTPGRREELRCRASALLLVAVPTAPVG